ncbi:unnamed protein product [Phytomonas sp. Hart1]|nr:unnamed protein product [Phytomonas sp. Hart1]|eukprot:CCW71941.1 unnamed protein product [Phytomonas sp. isolate Hart1]
MTLEKEFSPAGPSPAALFPIQRLLAENIAKLDDRAARVRAKLGETLRNFQLEAERGDRAQGAIQTLRNRLSECTKEENKFKNARDRAVKVVQEIDTRLQNAEAGLRTAREADASRRTAREAALKSQIPLERELLQREMQTFRHLLRDLTTLRGLLRGGALPRQKAILEELAKKCEIVENELPELQRGLEELKDEENRANAGESRAGLALHALRAAMKDQGEGLKTAVGAEAHLRARFELFEAELDETARGFLLELHLVQNAAREEGEGLRRRRRQRDLLRARYADGMARMAKRLQQPLLDSPIPPNDLHPNVNGGKAAEMRNGAFPALDLNTSPPEALHARVLLTRSYEREHLLQRGNYLDQRVLNLEKETEALRRLLELTKGEIKGSGKRRQNPQKNNEKMGELTANSSSRLFSEENPHSTRRSASEMELNDLQDGLNACGKMLRVEIERHEVLLESMKEQHGSLRARGKELKKTLASVEIEKKKTHTTPASRR